MGRYVLNISGKWVTAQMLNQALKKAGNAHARNVSSIQFNIRSGCNIMIDAALQLLSLANQLAHQGQSVTLHFEDGMAGTMGYLDRTGFFDHLSPSIQTIPKRPDMSAAKIYHNNNQGLLELLRIDPGSRDDRIPTVLADALEATCSKRDDKEKLGMAAFTVFSELINNIYAHSETPIAGYVALQTYKSKTNEKVFVVVSDSGIGLLETLRPTLKGKPLAKLSDPQLIVHMLNEGVSRFGAGHGAGLRSAALNALKYDATLNIRLPRASLSLIPAGNGYQAHAVYDTDLPLIKGTHMNFEFALDNSRKSG